MHGRPLLWLALGFALYLGVSHKFSPPASRTIPVTVARGNADPPPSSMTRLLSDSVLSPGRSVPSVPLPGRPILLVQNSSAKCVLPSRPKYLLVTDAEEGMGGWLRGLAEWIVLAQQFYMTLVEPCVADGAIVPCSGSPVAGDFGRAGRGERPTPSSPRPMSTYVDLTPVMRERRVRLISHDRFVRQFFSSPPEDRSFDIRIGVGGKFNVSGAGLPSDLLAAACRVGLRPWDINYNTIRVVDDLRRLLHPKGVAGTVLVLVHAFRHKRGTRLPGLTALRLSLRFAVLHRQAAQRFQAARLGPTFAALHWRASVLPPAQLPACTALVAAWVAAFRARGVPVLLVTDLPSRGSGYAAAWDNAHVANGTAAWTALRAPYIAASRRFEALSVLRYADYQPPQADKGAVAIQELVLALRARCLVVCVTAACGACTRPESKYTEELTQRWEEQVATSVASKAKRGLRTTPKAPYLKSWVDPPPPDGLACLRTRQQTSSGG
eukprot:EG_transcript_8203